jgi:pimeloyl-ACP methyl ester carboxylesterase
MTITVINAVGTTPVEAGATPLAAQLAVLPPGAPVLILLHADPHRNILSATSARRAPSWPRRMGFGRGQPGLCIAFGWEAGGTLWRAYAEAGRAGVALAALIGHIRALHDGPVSIMAHSLGARVALAALPLLAAGAVARMVLLAGAEFRACAQVALATPAGRSAEVLNVTSRENDIYDFLFERLLAPLSRSPALGAGLDLPCCLTLQIDAADHRAGLRRLGFRTADAARRVCHWSAYLRPGLFPLYRTFLLAPGTLPMPLLRGILPDHQAPRWSRLLALPLPLPRPRNAVQ